MTTTLTTGDTVKFHSPSSEDETMERVVVKEVREDRVLVELICEMSIRPTFVYLQTDLIEEP